MNDRNRHLIGADLDDKIVNRCLVTAFEDKATKKRETIADYADWSDFVSASKISG